MLSVKLAAILLFASRLTVLGPGVLSGADPGVLERVAERRLRNGWGLEQVDPAGFDVLVAPPDCALLGRDGWLSVGGRVHRVLVVDCEARHHRGQMARRGLLADVNRPELVHRKGLVILR